MLDEYIADFFECLVIEMCAFHELLAEIIGGHELLVIVVVIGLFKEFINGRLHEVGKNTIKDIELSFQIIKSIR